eukprot:6427035-Amphidinium_carterae.1
MGKKHIKVSDMAELKAEFCNKVGEMHHSDLLPDRRKVSLAYGPWQLEYSCRCVQEHGEAYLTLVLRYIAVSLGLLPALPCEDAAEISDQMKTKDIDTELLRETKAARKALSRYLECSKERPGSDMLQALSVKLCIQPTRRIC